MRTRHWCRMLIFAGLCNLPYAAQAQKIYVCKDAAGKTLTADMPMQECRDRPMRELDRNGMVRREIPAPLTAEQRKQKQLDEEKRKAEETAAARQKQADMAMLARYGSELEIEAARRRTLEQSQEQLKHETAALAAAERNRKDLESQIEQSRTRNRDISALQAKLEESERSTADIRKKKDARQAEAMQINQRFDATVRRYRELTGATVSAAAK